MAEVERLHKDRRSLRRWLRGQIRKAEELRAIYREDGALCSSAQQDGRADAFRAVLLVLDGGDRKSGKAKLLK
jgi:hypothetical protein